MNGPDAGDDKQQQPPERRGRTVSGDAFLSHLRSSVSYPPSFDDQEPATTTDAAAVTFATPSTDNERRWTEPLTATSLLDALQHPSLPAGFDGGPEIGGLDRSVSDSELNRSNHLALEDVIRAEPKESEHDTALLRSIDERALGGAMGDNDDYNYSFDSDDENAPLNAKSRHNHHISNMTGTSSILSQVPEDIVHEFEISMGSGLAIGNANAGLGRSNDEAEPEAEASRQSPRSTAPAPASGRPPLQRGATSRRMSVRSMGHHHRGLSVEQTLVGLTEALSALHGSPRPLRERNHDRLPSSTADEFAVNLEMLHHQHTGAAASPGGDGTSPSASPTDNEIGDGNAVTSPLPDPTPRTGRRLWDTLMEGLPALKENGGRDWNTSHGTSTPSGSNSSNSEEVDPVSSPSPGGQPDLEAGGHLVSGGEGQSSGYRDSSSKRKHSRHGKKNHKILHNMTSSIHSSKRSSDHFRKELELWNGFFRPRRSQIMTYLKVITLYVVLPLVGVAAALFYLVRNPSAGDMPDPLARPSASFILLFCARQVITFTLALGMQLIIIDFLALNTRIMLYLLGPIITLLVVQAKGWPFIIFWWSIFDFALLSGDGPFAHHWLYYQDVIYLFNERNPSGDIVSNQWYMRILAVAASVSVVVALKRFAVGLYLGRQTYAHYGEPLTKVMSKILLVSEVAGLARDLEWLASEQGADVPSKIVQKHVSQHGLAFGRSDGDENGDDNDDSDIHTMKSGRGSVKNLIDPNRREFLTGSLPHSEKIRLTQLLDQWEEPERRNGSNNEAATISAVLRFRKALAFMHQLYPFSVAFGPANTREACLESAQEVYKRLLLSAPDDVDHLQFESLAILTLDRNENIDKAKAKAMIKLFRPGRNGELTLIDFCKSIDAVYKEFRLLGATIENSSTIDRAFENMFNIIFYTVVGCVVLSQLGFDPLALFLSLSSVILAFAFMIGSASAKYFEGVLFILVRRPYGIGDFISISNIEKDSSLHGVLPWKVDNVTLFETEVVHLPTNERASLSNGSLSNSRIVNWKRSPQAQFHIFLQFPLNVPYSKLVLFRKAVEEYMKARPREWRALNGFRANMVYAKENYMEYIIVIQHREAWQEVGQVLDSKANLTSYCQEIARKLGMEYRAPILPVQMSGPMPQSSSYDGTLPTVDEDEDDNSLDQDAFTQTFQSIARRKHSLRTS